MERNLFPFCIGGGVSAEHVPTDRLNGSLSHDLEPSGRDVESNHRYHDS